MSSVTGGGAADDLSLGFLVHALLSCAQPDASRDFLCKHKEVRQQLFTIIQARSGFHVGSIAACAGDAALADSLAGLALLTAAAGTAARRQLLRHICAHSDAYLTLLLPHLESSHHAAQLLSALAACSDDEADALDSADALAYLRLLAALAARLACLGETAAGRPAGGGGLSPQRATLAAAVFGSVVSLTATIEGGLRQDVASEASARTKGGLRQDVASEASARTKRKPLTPEKLQAEVDQSVRQRLPAADITTAVAASQRIALCHTPTLLEHTHGQCSSLVVALLRLDLLQLRLPRTKQAAMRALGALLKEGPTLGSCLHASLEQALGGAAAARGRSGTLLLLQVLSTAKASLKCLQAAADSGLHTLLPGLHSRDKAERQAQTFVCCLLCMAHGAPDSEARTMQLLWQLALRPGSSSAAARKASDILLWALAPPLPALVPTVRDHAAQGFSAADMAAVLAAPAGAAGITGPSAFCWELGKALANCPACVGSAQDLLSLRAALAARERQQRCFAPHPAAGGPQSTLDRLNSANLEELDGFVQPGAAASRVPASAAAPAAAGPAGGGAPHASTAATPVLTAAGPVGCGAPGAACTAAAPSGPAGGTQPSAKEAELGARQRRLQELKRLLEDKQCRAAATAAGGLEATPKVAAAAEPDSRAAPAPAGSAPAVAQPVLYCPAGQLAAERLIGPAPAPPALADSPALPPAPPADPATASVRRAAAKAAQHTAAEAAASAMAQRCLDQLGAEASATQRTGSTKRAAEQRAGSTEQAAVALQAEATAKQRTGSTKQAAEQHKGNTPPAPCVHPTLPCLSYHDALGVPSVGRHQGDASQAPGPTPRHFSMLPWQPEQRQPVPVPQLPSAADATAQPPFQPHAAPGQHAQQQQHQQTPPSPSQLWPAALREPGPSLSTSAVAQLAATAGGSPSMGCATGTNGTSGLADAAGAHGTACASSAAGMQGTAGLASAAGAGDAAGSGGPEDMEIDGGLAEMEWKRSHAHTGEATCTA